MSQTQGGVFTREQIPCRCAVHKASGAWLPCTGCHRGCRGLERPRVCLHVLPGGGLHPFPQRRDCYLIDGRDSGAAGRIDGRDSGAAGRLDMCAWLEFLFSSLFLFCP